MQSIPGYPTDFDVAEPTALVTVNGVPYDVESLTVTRELSSNLPEQVTSASGYTAATGSVEWVVGEDVQERSAHPWDGNTFPPKPSDSVVAYMGYGDVMARQLTGVIDRSDGSVAEGSVSSGVVDAIDKLNQPVSFPAHLAEMPPHVDGGPFLHVGNEPIYTADRILRTCGFYATPPMSTGCVLSVPFMGSSWPERGTVTASSRQDFANAPTSHAPTQWGIGTNSCNATYTPDLSHSGGNGKLDRTFQITVKASSTPGTTGHSSVYAYWGTRYILLRVTGDRKVTAVVYTGSSVTVCELSAAAAESADVFTLRVTPAGVFTILANNGATTSGSAALPAVITTTNLSSILILVSHLTGTRIGGVQVNFGETSVYSSPQTASLTRAAFSWSLPAVPRIDNRNALEVLKEQAEAECAAMWIDEHGVFRRVNRYDLTGAAPVAALTAMDVLDIGWESNADGVRSRVEVSSHTAAISRSAYTNKVAWQGSGSSLEPNETVEEFAEPGGDEDWIGVDESLEIVAKPTEHPDWFNRGIGTWGGGIETDDANEQWAHVGNAGFNVTMERSGSFSYKLITTAGTPTPGRTVELRTPSLGFSPTLRKSKTNYVLPVIRAKAIVEWKEKITTGTVKGPPNSAALTHDVGPWVQDPEALQELADWLAVQVSAPRPVLRDLNVIPDFRRQLGDVVWVEDPDNMRIRLKVLLTKISTTVSPGNADQSIAGQILQVQSYGPTNAQLDKHAGKFTNTGFGTLWADATNAQLDANPLGRG